MSKLKKEDAPFPKTEKDELRDRILGSDEEMSDELASRILESYDIDENQLINAFKARIQTELKKTYDPNSQDSQNLSNTLKNISEYQRAASPRSVEPKDWIANLINKVIPPTAHAQPLYSFRKREDGEMSDHDKQILDDLRAELENEKE